MLKDRFGHEVFIGCTVVYPGRAGSSCWLTTGVVEAIVPEALDGSFPAMPKLKLIGGTLVLRGQRRLDWHTGLPVEPLGRRTITWSQEVIVLGA